MKDLKTNRLNIIDLTEKLPVHKYKTPDELKEITYIVIHTINGVVTPRGLAKYDIGPNHISKTGCPTFTYHYFLRRDGEINQTVNHNIVTWHAGKWNEKSLAVALNYKLDKEWEKKAYAGTAVSDLPPNKNNAPSKEMMDSLYNLLVELCLAENISPINIRGHRELKGTGWTFKKGSKVLRKHCPGMSINLDSVRGLVTINLQIRLKGEGFYKGVLDGSWGKKSAEALAQYSKK